MQLGVALPQYSIDVTPAQPVWTSMLAAARKASSAGLDAVWLSDHPFAVGPDGVASGALDPLVSAAALLGSVPRIRVGTLVLASTVRAPGLVAHMARTIWSREGRRVVIGVGAGWYEPEHQAFGLRLPSYAARVVLLEETIDALGERRDGRPRVLLGGTGGSALELAARKADAWNVAWDITPERFADLNRRLDDACARMGRDPATLSRSVGLTVLVATDEEGLDRAIDRLRGRAAFLTSLDRRTLAERIVCGTPEVCAERIAAYKADEVVAALLLRDDPEMLDLFGERVAPLL